MADFCAAVDSLALQPTAHDRLTNSAFEQLMWAFARPGIERRLPAGGYAALAESLLDRECSFHAGDDVELTAQLAATGAVAVPLAKADYVFSHGMADSAGFEALRTGTLAYPDEAATLFLEAGLDGAQRLSLSGPGIRHVLVIAVDGIAPAFWDLRARLIRYPLGFDLYIVDGDRLVGIPRSTKIEVL